MCCGSFCCLYLTLPHCFIFPCYILPNPILIISSYCSSTLHWFSLPYTTLPGLTLPISFFTLPYFILPSRYFVLPNLPHLTSPYYTLPDSRSPSPSRPISTAILSHIFSQNVFLIKTTSPLSALHIRTRGRDYVPRVGDCSSPSLLHSLTCLPGRFRLLSRTSRLTWLWDLKNWATDTLLLSTSRKKVDGTAMNNLISVCLCWYSYFMV